MGKISFYHIVRTCFWHIRIDAIVIYLLMSGKQEIFVKCLHENGKTGARVGGWRGTISEDKREFKKNQLM